MRVWNLWNIMNMEEYFVKFVQNEEKINMNQDLCVQIVGNLLQETMSVSISEILKERNKKWVTKVKVAIEKIKVKINQRKKVVNTDEGNKVAISQKAGE